MLARHLGWVVGYSPQLGWRVISYEVSHMPVTPSWHALVLRVLEHPVTAQIKAVQTIPFPDEHRACNL